MKIRSIVLLVCLIVWIIIVALYGYSGGEYLSSLRIIIMAALEILCLLSISKDLTDKNKSHWYDNVHTMD